VCAASLCSDPGHGFLDLLQAERGLVRRGLRHEVLDAGLEAVETRRKKRVQRVDLGGGALGLE